MKKMRKVIGVCLATALCLSLLASCGSDSSADNPTGNANSDEPIVVRISGSVNDNHPVTQIQYKLEELFEEATNGAYDVQVFPNGSFGNVNESLEAIQLGNLEMCDSGNMILAPYTNKLMFMDIPYLFSSHDVAMAFAQSDVAEELYDRIAEETGIRPLLPSALGYMTVMNNVREIHSPEDLQGVKLRVQETDMYLEYFESLGSSPIPMSLSEVFTAAQQGTVDGVTTQCPVFYAQGFYDVIEYVSDVNPYFCIDYLYTSEQWLNSLPEADREIFLDCVAQAVEYGEEITRAYIEETDTELESLSTVTHLTDEERAVFEDAAAHMYDYFRETVNDPYLDDYLAEIEAIEASLG